jgi:O-antigen/teichoic acid export membrane protein
MLKMLRGLLTLAPMTFLTIFTALIQAKILAVLLGPKGMGFFFLAISFLNLMTTIAAVGATSSVTKLVAEFGGSGEENAIVPSIVLALVVVTTVSAGLMLLLLIDQELFRRLMLGGSKLDAGDRRFVLVLTLLALFPTAWNVVAQASLRGLRSIHHYARAGSLAIVLLLLCVTIPAWLWGVRGALVGSVVGQFLSLGTFGFFSLRVLRSRRSSSEAPGPHSKPSNIARRLLQLGALALIAGLAAAVGQNAVRSYLAAHLSLTAVAFFGAAWSLSNKLPLLIYQTFSAYTIPRISSFGQDWEKIRTEQNHAMRLAFLAAAPAIAVVISAQNIVIPLLFSSKFLPMGDLMRTMLVGELLSILFWVMSLALYPTGRAGLNVIAEWAWWALFLAGVVLLTARWGLESIGWAYLGAYAIMASVLYAWQRSRHDFHLTSDNSRLLLLSILLVSTVAIAGGIGQASGWTRAAVTALGLCLWSIFAPSARERAAARRIISRGFALTSKGA